jgi:hypothetical protein
MTFTTVVNWFKASAKEDLEKRDACVVQELDREAIIRTIDELARKRCGISAHELLSSFRAGRLAVAGDVTDLIAYSNLLSPDDPIFFVEDSAPSQTRYALR